MNIAFYAPLKPPDHPVPSGDRQMARLLIEAMNLAGHDVQVASQLRSYISESTPQAVMKLEANAKTEINRIADKWKQTAKPDLWFSYHPYYKAPDLVGTVLAHNFGIPYVTAEASYSRRRNTGVWAETQAHVAAAVKLAKVNVCFTERDRDGLAAMAPEAHLEMLRPFIDTAPFAFTAGDNPTRLMTIAMMRKGDKFDSFTMLAKALAMLVDLPWTLTVIGGGDLRNETTALFEALPPERFEWLGEIDPGRVPDLLKEGGIYVWPGSGEAYGLAYLEAQAAGLPVVAQATAGVPEVVRGGVTGILTDHGDVAAFASAIRHLLTNPDQRCRMAAAARRFVLNERSLSQASKRLGAILAAAVGQTP